MFTAIQIAEFFLLKDKIGNASEKINDRNFCEGDARLNVYLHLAQNIYIAKTGEKLFVDDLYAYSIGAVALNVHRNYPILDKRRFKMVDVDLPEEIELFLAKILRVFQIVKLDELIEFSREDPEWLDKRGVDDQRMDSLARVEEYREQYKDILKVMDGIDL